MTPASISDIALSTGMQLIEAAANALELGAVESGLTTLAMGLHALHCQLENPQWRQLCRLAQRHRLAGLLKDDPIVAAAYARPFDRTALIDAISRGSVPGKAGHAAWRLHAVLTRSTLAHALRERDSQIAEQFRRVFQTMDSPGLLTVASTRIADDVEALDLAVARTLFDWLPTAKAMRITRSIADRLRPGGVFLFSSLAEGNAEAAFVECVLHLRPAWRSQSEMRAIAAAAGPGLARRHYSSRNGAVHFCELLRP